MNYLHRSLVSTLFALTACSGNEATPTDAGTTTGSSDESSTGEAPTTTGELPGSTGETGDETTGDVDSSTGDGGESSSTGEPEPFLEGAPTPNVDIEEQDIDVFGALGNRYWFAVDPAEVERMNETKGQEPDIYTPGNPATYANHLFASTPGDGPQIADYGKVEVRVVGQSTFRPWTKTTIPSLKVDTDEFTDGLEVGGVEHLRFNNSLVGTIFRERMAYAVYAALDYPAPRVTYAWVGSNVWGPAVEIPYTLVEVYKNDFCKARADQLGGGCSNIWEFVGELTEAFNQPGSCQVSTCDNARVQTFVETMMATQAGPGFKDALADYVAWDEYHRFQCISWLLWTGDDALHNMNNVVLVERKDGLFQYLPYSVDISAGQSWYQDTPLYGMNALSVGCQADPDCWQDTIAVCEDVVAEFVAADPVAMIDEIYAGLGAEGMLRDGDDGRHGQIRGWYEQRAATALVDLEQFTGVSCSPEQVKCDGQCVDVQACVLACAPGEVQCGPTCALEGECFACEWPFEMCPNNTCVPYGQC